MSKSKIQDKINSLHQRAQERDLTAEFQHDYSTGQQQIILKGMYVHEVFPRNSKGFHAAFAFLRERAKGEVEHCH